MTNNDSHQISVRFPDDIWNWIEKQSKTLTIAPSIFIRMSLAKLKEKKDDNDNFEEMNRSNYHCK